MNWMSIFNRTKNITTEQTREYVKTHAPGTFQLLDVRQPKEYLKGHLPGSILIPLKELPERLAEIDPGLETIVYCHSGVRSRAAYQILKAGNFKNVRNMAGGISRWEGLQATGSESLGLEYFTEGNFSSVFAMAYAMEKGLQQFYLLLAVRTEDEKCRDLLTSMARLEDGHMAKLMAQYPDQARSEIARTTDEVIIEGGIDAEEFLEEFGDQVVDEVSILQVAMGFESQAYDLYNRLARRHDEPELRAFFKKMAKEEQVHLDRLSSELDKRLP